MKVAVSESVQLFVWCSKQNLNTSAGPVGGVPDTNEWPPILYWIVRPVRASTWHVYVSINASSTQCRCMLADRRSCIVSCQKPIVVRATGRSTSTSFQCGIGIVGLFERTGSFFSFSFLRFVFSALSKLPTSRFRIETRVLLGLE